MSVEGARPVAALPGGARHDQRQAAAAVPAVSAVHVALALVTVYVLWGSTYLAMRLAIATIPPFLMAASRHFTAGVLLYAFARWRGAPRPRPEHWRSAAIIGGLLLLLGNGGVVWAEQRVSSGMAALLICSEPMWIVLFVWLRRDGRRPRPQVVAGLLVGVAGLALLVRPGAHAGGAGVDLLGVLAVLISSISWAAGSLYVQRATLPSSPLLATSLQMLCGGGLLFAAGGLTGEPARFAFSQVSAGSALAVLYLIVFGSLIGYTAYTWLLRSASPVLVSTYAYVNPVVAVFLGWALVHEPVTGGMLLGAAVILFGVALITTASGDGASRRRKAAEQPGREAAGALRDRQQVSAAPPVPEPLPPAAAAVQASSVRTRSPAVASVAAATEAGAAEAAATADALAIETCVSG
ncbi:MAG TPA: EamA family transporter [Thermoanaerobaculia bacterium]|jgi:drug/metabolite transporter (DMT)-like permease|nr:EamA family transporter [Thermoanaerobaculia bacterium]